MTSSAERELRQIRQAQQDPQAFAPLYDAYYDLIWRFAMSRTGDRERAADVASQTFIKAITNLHRFTPKIAGEATTLRPWLMQIARNVMIDEQRKHRPTVDIDAPAHLLELRDTTPSPESRAIMAEERHRIRTAIDQLAPRQRQLVELRISGYSGKDIAAILGMSLNGVRAAHHRAYTRLRELLADDQEGHNA